MFKSLATSTLVLVMGVACSGTFDHADELGSETFEVSEPRSALRPQNKILLPAIQSFDADAEASIAMDDEGPPSGLKLYVRQEPTTWTELSEREQRMLLQTLEYVAVQGGRAEQCGSDETGWSCIVDGVLHWCDHEASGPVCGTTPIE